MDYNFDYNYDKNMDFNFSATTQTILQFKLNYQQFFENKLMIYPEYRLYKSINYYGYITEVTVGSVANILVLIIMLGLRHLPICNYMAALALADLSVLASCFIRWLAYVNYDLKVVNTALCRIVNFQAYYSFSLSAWLLVAMTVDRYIAITYPLKAIRISTPCRSRIVITILVLVTAAINFHFLITLFVYKPNAQTQMCTNYKRFSYFMGTVWPWIDATVYSFLPFTFLIIFNFLIIRSHIKSKTVQAELKGIGELSVTSSHISRRITITLLIVTFTFIILTAPKVILTIIRPTIFNFLPQTGKVNFKLMAHYLLTSSLVDVLIYGNHCVNFILYVLTGHKFRQQLINKFKCQRKPSLSCTLSAQVESNSTETIVTNVRIKNSSTKEDLYSNETELRFHKNINSSNLPTVYKQQFRNSPTNFEELQHQHLSAVETCNIWSVNEQIFPS